MAKKKKPYSNPNLIKAARINREAKAMSKRKYR